jgi:hypothetical protein
MRSRPSSKRSAQANPRKPRSRSRDFEFDDDLRWFFHTVGKEGQRHLRSHGELLRWRRIDTAVCGLWRLCLYFSNPRGFARPLLASLVQDNGSHGATWLYGLLPDQRADRFHREERKREDQRLFAMQPERELSGDEAFAIAGLDQEYARYRERLLAPRRNAIETVCVPRDMLRGLVGVQFETRRSGEYATAISAENVIDDYLRLGQITWSTWRDYLVAPEAARQILHKRRAPGVAGMSDREVIRALTGVVEAQVRQRGEEERLAAEEARAFDAEAVAEHPKYPRTRRQTRKAKIADWLSTTLALEISVAEIAQASRLSQKVVRELLVAQACPGVTLASGEPPSDWLERDAGRAFKTELAVAIEAAAESRRQANVARRGRHAG